MVGTDELNGRVGGVQEKWTRKVWGGGRKERLDDGKGYKCGEERAELG